THAPIRLVRVTDAVPLGKEDGIAEAVAVTDGAHPRRLSRLVCPRILDPYREGVEVGLVVRQGHLAIRAMVRLASVRVRQAMQRLKPHVQGHVFAGEARAVLLAGARAAAVALGLLW